MTPARVLVVEDDRVVARDLLQRLTRMGHSVVGVARGADEALALAESARPDLVLMDIELEGATDGIEAAKQIRERCQRPIIYVTGHADDDTLRRASLTEPYAFLIKPFDESQLKSAIEMGLYKHTAERRIRDSERRYAVTLSSIGDAVIATDDRFQVSFMNPVAERLTGWSFPEAVGRALGEVFRVVDEDTGAPLEEPAPGALRTASALDLTTQTALRARDGRIVAIDDRRSPIIDDRGDVTGEVLVFRDMTQRRQAEEAVALRALHAWIDEAARGSSIGIWEYDLLGGDLGAGRHTVWNLWEQLGYPEPVVTDGAFWRTLLHPDDRERVEAAVVAHLGGRESGFEVELRLRRADGSYRWFLVRGVAPRDGRGTVMRFVGTSVDITERKRLERDLRAATAAAEAANEAKDEFLANVSHELRTPMNAILGMTELVLETPLSEYQRPLVKTVESAAGSLLGIIDDLLDFSKMEAGKIELDSAEFFLRPLLGDTLQALASRAHAKGLELICDVRADVPDGLVGDAGRLRQVLVNLVGNAIKFTAEGEVAVEVGVAPDAPPAGEVALCVAVRDTGIGVSPDKQAAIFGAFEQEDLSTTKKYGGTGLGLTIAARLIALMGGELTLDSAPGRGSTFSFTVRCRRQPGPRDQERVQPPPLLRDVRVLVVEDNGANRRVLEAWLRGWHMAPTLAGDGAEAMDALSRGASSGRPHQLILLDARMPDIDGLELAAKIRGRAELGGSRIILLFSGDRPGDARPGERVDAHLRKPVMRDELLDAIYRVMDAAPGPAAAPQPVATVASAVDPPRRAATALRVLVAEDNDINAFLIQEFMRRRGHAVVVAANGREALALVEREAFDLLLLDLHMPDLDGFDVIRAIRARERSAGGHLPVIALTARSRPEDRERALAAGMDDFLTKPLWAANLWSALDRVLPPDVAIDAPALLAASGGDEEILAALLEVLQEQLPKIMADMGRAHRHGDAAALRAAAHKASTLLAAFSNHGGRLAADLEDRAARGALHGTAPMVGELGALVPRLLGRLGGLTVAALRRACAGDEKGTNR